MQQYTTEWAKEYLMEHEWVIVIAQDQDGEVWNFNSVPIIENEEWINYDNEGYIGKSNSLDFMLEHPDGWENSKVTREDL